MSAVVFIDRLASSSLSGVGAWRLHDHLTNVLFALCSHPGRSGTSEALPGFPERASDLHLRWWRG
jgi:hypothetical protein